MGSFDFETTLVPLTLLIVLGWLIGRMQDIDLKSVATMLVYAITPVVALGSTAQMNFRGAFALLPVVTYTLAGFTGMLSFALGKRLLKHKDMRYLLPQATACGNNGYFGLPLAMALFPPEQVGVYFLVMLGTTLFESTVGYYFVGRGKLPVREALRRAARMPVIYAILSGLGLSAAHVQLSSGLLELLDATRGCYVSLGMMLIGIALAKHKRLAWNVDFIALVMFGKYILWALAVVAFVWLDAHVLGLYDAPVYAMIAIMAITPVAANTAAFAAQHDFRPQHAATVVFLTTIISFVFLPVVLPLVFTFSQH